MVSPRTLASIVAGSALALMISAGIKEAKPRALARYYAYQSRTAADPERGGSAAKRLIEIYKTDPTVQDIVFGASDCAVEQGYNPASKELSYGLMFLAVEGDREALFKHIEGRLQDAEHHHGTARLLWPALPYVPRDPGKARAYEAMFFPRNSDEKSLLERLYDSARTQDPRGLGRDNTCGSIATVIIIGLALGKDVNGFIGTYCSRDMYDPILSRTGDTMQAVSGSKK